MCCEDEFHCYNCTINFECPPDCHPGCQNQRFRARLYKKVSILEHEYLVAYGLKTAQKLQPNDFIMEYVGKIITKWELSERMQKVVGRPEHRFYFMNHENGYVIDAGDKANLSRYINHSCNPNCYLSKWVVDGRICVGIHAKKIIARGEELTIAYDFDSESAKILLLPACRCNPAQCTRSFTLLPAQLKRRYTARLESNRNEPWAKKRKIPSELSQTDGPNSDELHSSSTVPSQQSQSSSISPIQSIIKPERVEAPTEQLESRTVPEHTSLAPQPQPLSTSPAHVVRSVFNSEDFQNKDTETTGRENIGGRVDADKVQPNFGFAEDQAEWSDICIPSEDGSATRLCNTLDEPEKGSGGTAFNEASAGEPESKYAVNGGMYLVAGSSHVARAE